MNTHPCPQPAPRAQPMRVALALALAALSGACGLSRVTLDRGDEASVTAPTSQTLPTPLGDTNAPVDPNVPPPAASGPFALSLTGSGFTPHVGQTVNAALIDGDGTRVAGDSATVAADGSFALSFPAALSAEKNYSVSYYADVNKNGLCNAPPVDHSWRVEVPAATSDTAVPVVHNADFVPVCGDFGSFGLTFHGADFSGHAGQGFYIAVVDAADNTQVGEVKHGTIPASGEVLFGWPTLLLPDHAYTLAYFADRNASHSCDFAADGSLDHAWLTAVPKVSGDVMATGSHNSPQMAVCAFMPTGKLD